jgi:predicted transposase/invertase (TIGR01784 family)
MDLEEKLTPEEKWERATIANNFIFYKVMRNNTDVCKRLLEILLEMEIDYIEMSSEEEINIDFQSKGIRMDVYAKNQKECFNVEMQATDTNELPERARYYQGVIDVDILRSGQTYKELKNSYIIFICIEDIFKKGLAKYTFENSCLESPEIKLNDRAYKYFFIAKNSDKILNEEQKAFLQLVINKKGTDSFTKQIEKLAEEAKSNLQWKRQYMEWERQRVYDFEAGREKGLEQGASQKAIEDASNLLKMNLATPEQIAQAISLPVERVLELQKELQK